jgi:hypothetical protein
MGKTTRGRRHVRPPARHDCSHARRCTRPRLAGAVAPPDQYRPVSFRSPDRSRHPQNVRRLDVCTSFQKDELAEPARKRPTQTRLPGVAVLLARMTAQLRLLRSRRLQQLLKQRPGSPCARRPRGASVVRAFAIARASGSAHSLARIARFRDRNLSGLGRSTRSPLATRTALSRWEHLRLWRARADHTGAASCTSNYLLIGRFGRTGTLPTRQDVNERRRTRHCASREVRLVLPASV